MPWLEFYSPELTLEQRKDLATQFMEKLTEILSIPKEMVGIKFDSYKPDHVWIKQGLLSEKPGETMYHLSIFGPSFKPEQKKEIYREIAKITTKVLNLNEQKQREFGIAIMDLPIDNYSKGGLPISEVMAAAKH